MKMKLVTGYIPLESSSFYRSHEDFKRLGARLRATPVPIRMFIDKLEDCWLHYYLKGRPQFPAVTHSTGGNPAKDTLEYLIILHQKTEWLLRARTSDMDVDVFVWMDYGIFHQEGFTEELVSDFFSRVKLEEAVAIPGLWEKGPVSDTEPCWRFCGSMFVCPAVLVSAFDDAVKAEIKQHLIDTNNVVWDVNNWARVEAKNILPIRWYSAGHNASMLTNY
jgi:hypothetical protein